MLVLVVVGGGEGGLVLEEKVGEHEVVGVLRVLERVWGVGGVGVHPRRRRRRRLLRGGVGG
jgi:hypothetical protein